MADDSGPIQPLRRAPGASAIPGVPPQPPQAPQPPGRPQSSGSFQALPAAAAPAGRNTGRFNALPAADPNATPAIAELDARIWPRVVEAFRRAEPGFVQQFLAALDAKLPEKLGPLQSQLAALDARALDLDARQTALDARTKALEEQAQSLAEKAAALDAKAAEIAQVVEQVKLLELELGAIKPALAGADGQVASPGEAFVNAVVESGKFSEILGKRFRVQTERMVQFLQQEIEKKFPKGG